MRRIELGLVVCVALVCSGCIETPTYVGGDTSSKDMAQDANVHGDMDMTDVSDLADTGNPDTSDMQDAAPDLGPCAQTCVDPTPACDTDSGACVACIGDSDCGDELVCDTSSHECVSCLNDEQCEGDMRCDTASNTCVTCLENTDCSAANASVCDASSNTCASCSLDEDCEHITGKNTCNSGTCVECTPNNEAETCGIFSCDPVTFTCTDIERGTVDDCEPCKSDSDCLSGGCVEMSYKSESNEVPVGSFCQPPVVDNSCPSHVYSTPREVTTRSGNTAIFCHINEVVTTCGATLSSLDNVACDPSDLNGFSADCGLDGVNDGVCVEKDVLKNSLCSVVCEVDADCRSSEECKAFTAGELMGRKACVQD